MTLKVTFFFIQDRYTWSEAHYLSAYTQLQSGVGAALAYANLRVPCLGNDAELSDIRISQVPADRVILDVDNSLFNSIASWPADPTNQIYASDRAYSSVLVKMATLTGNRNWYVAGCPDAEIQSVRGVASGLVFNGAPGWLARMNAFMTYLLGTWSYRQLADDFPFPVTSLVTNATYPGMVGVVTAASVGASSGSVLYLKGFRRINTRSPGLSGYWRVGAVLNPTPPATTPYTYFLANSGNVSPTNFSTLGDVNTPAYTYPTYTDYSLEKAVSRKRGGSAFLPRGRSRIRG